MSGSIVGKFGYYGLNEWEFVDGSPGEEVFLAQPLGLARLNSSTIAIADEHTHMIRLYDVETNEATSLAGKFGKVGSDEGNSPLGMSCLYYPRDVAVSPDGKYVYVSNYYEGFVNRIDLKKDRVDIVARHYNGHYDKRESALGTPGHLHFDNDGNLLIADPYMDSIYKLTVNEDPNKCVLTRLHLTSIENPNSIAINPANGDMVVASHGGTCLYHFINRDGQFVENHQVIGTCGTSGFGDGTRDKAILGVIYQMVWSPGGEVLFMADFYNDRIRYMPRDLSFIATLAGRAANGNDPGDLITSTLTNPVGLVLMGNRLMFSQSTGPNIRSIGTLVLHQSDLK